MAAVALADRLAEAFAEYLHREIREKGGAYGGFALYNAEDGLFSFGSYRDPHIVGTLNVYSGAADFIRSGKFTEKDVNEAILQVCSEIDKPDPPGPAARKAFYRRIIGLSDDARRTFKAGLLQLDKAKVQTVARRHWSTDNPAVATAVISSAEKLAEVSKIRMEQQVAERSAIQEMARIDALGAGEARRTCPDPSTIL